MRDDGLFLFVDGCEENFAPSQLVTLRSKLRTPLDEGKAFGRSPDAHLVVSKDSTIRATMDPAGYAGSRKSGVTVGRRILLQAQQETEDALHALIERHYAGAVPEGDFRDQATTAMRKAWKRVFIAGLRSGGIQEGKQGVPLGLSAQDQKFLAGAVAHEMRYLNRFLTDMVEGRGRMDYYRRATMYVHSLQGFYESARVMALPATSIIRWVGPEDHRTCASCKYLFDHNPYTRATLPTTPRSGTTICLTNCRDRLLVRQSTPEQVLVATRAGRTRQQHLRALERIKAKG